MSTAETSPIGFPMVSDLVAGGLRRLLVSVKEAAYMLGVSKRTLERLIASGDFPAPVKIGGCVRIPLSVIEGYLKGVNERRSQS